VADTIDELRAEVAKWREQGNDGTGVMVNIRVAEELLRRPDLNPAQCSNLAALVDWRYVHEDDRARWASTLAALRATAEGAIR